MRSAGDIDEPSESEGQVQFDIEVRSGVRNPLAIGVERCGRRIRVASRQCGGEPPGLVTVTSTTPAARASVQKTTTVVLFTTICLAFCCPSCTIAPGWKSVPVMVLHAPPSIDPLSGAMVAMEGRTAGLGGSGSGLTAPGVGVADVGPGWPPHPSVDRHNRLTTSVRRAEYFVMLPPLSWKRKWRTKT